MVCTPQNIAAQSNCFTCLPHEERECAIAYLLAQILNQSSPTSSTDPKVIAKAACATGQSWKSLTTEQRQASIVYLLCQILTASGG